MDDTAAGHDTVRTRVERKILLRLILPIAVITFVNSIDRVNVSYSGTAMSAELGLSPAQFGQGVSMFFIAYLVFQYPHAWLLRRWGIKPWIFGSMLVWAASGVWMSRIHSVGQFYAARFLLGVAEAGFAPGMTWLISRWAPREMRARALAGALIAVPLSMVLGGPLCGWLLSVANPLALPSWRFMFLMIALPNLILAVAAGLYLVDTPRQARWLTAAELEWLESRSTAQADGAQVGGATFGDVMRDPWLWRCCAAWLLIMTGSYALVFWLPQLVRQMQIGSSELVIATLSTLPLLGLAIGLWANGRRSDRKGERLLHVGVPSALAGVAMLIAAALAPGWSVLALLFVAGLGIGATQGVFWAIPSAVRIGGPMPTPWVIALVSMFGTAGGIIGPWLTGTLVGRTGNFSLAIALLASLLILAFPVIVPDGARRSQA